MGMIRTDVWKKRDPRPPPDLGQGSLRAVQEAGQPQCRSGPASEVVASRDRRHQRSGLEGPSAKCDPGHDIKHSDARMDSFVLGEVKPGQRGLGQRANTLMEGFIGSPKSQNGAIMEGVAMDIQEAGPRRLLKLGHQVATPALAHVDHALEHAFNVAYRRPAFLSPVPERTEDLPKSPNRGADDQVKH